jgi:hypothetical protein
MKNLNVVTTLLLLFLLSSFEAKSEIVKKSKSDICHDRYSSYYDKTKNFTSVSSHY